MKFPLLKFRDAFKYKKKYSGITIEWSFKFCRAFGMWIFR